MKTVFDMASKHRRLKHAPWEITEALSKNPELIENPEYDVREWEIQLQIDSVYWFKLLAKQLQFATYYDWRRRDYQPWSELLEAQPELESCCIGWNWIERLELVAMYYRCPEIIRRCQGIIKISDSDGNFTASGNTASD